MPGLFSCRTSRAGGAVPVRVLAISGNEIYVRKILGAKIPHKRGSFGIICGMNNKFRVGLRIGGSSSEIPLYCSWPFGVVEFHPDKLTFHGPFVGRLALQSEAIVEICARCSFLSRSVRIKYRNGSSVGVIDIYSFKVKTVMAAIDSWRQEDLKHRETAGDSPRTLL